ncbi:16S rRNA (uracil(1498)-N(3))-methyltransferase [Desulforhopalus singaporensis]|uniref:Ribosomal RNA small subunit methyltransferase E n=1 Tax=Desulforhopalus singaporensis TaxID=91360 RepID=A0A1H0U7C5_9BACT|nr:16S rRNA (uracil(1498)-N(3))-methyltransferase [Desulforhopalus singaporensis]SDP62061.1 RNA methyltransferase, RsmE family [Desulforhopalus singaporensis]
MNIILVEKEEIQENSVILTDHRAEHIVKILRSAVGETIKIGVVGGNMGTGEILSVGRKYPFTVEIRLTLTIAPPPVAPIDLVLALPRPIMLKRILRQVTALGVGKIHLINANRVEKSFWEATVLDPLELRANLVQGLEQAVDTRLPEVFLHRRFRPFIEDFVAETVQDYGHLVCAHPAGHHTLSGRFSAAGAGRVLLAIGPEGGWVDFEVDKFCRQGFACCTIGHRILKVDTAVIAVHSRISALLEAAGNQTSR